MTPGLRTGLAEGLAPFQKPGKSTLIMFVGSPWIQTPDARIRMKEGASDGGVEV